MRPATTGAPREPAGPTGIAAPISEAGAGNLRGGVARQHLAVRLDEALPWDELGKRGLVAHVEERRAGPDAEADRVEMLEAQDAGRREDGHGDQEHAPDPTSQDQDH